MYYFKLTQLYYIIYYKLIQKFGVSVFLKKW